MPGDDLRAYLYQTGIEGILFVLNLPDNRVTRWIVEWLFGRFFANVIDTAVTFDEMIAERSLSEACAWIAARCGAPAMVYGVENIPVEGPALLACNHPGYFDTMAVAAQLPRDDLRVVVGGVPYFTELPNTSKFIFYTDLTQSSSVRVLRNCVAHLRAGGIALIYPTGQADPDPDVLSGASAQLEDWSRSVAVMLRRVPETRLVPVAVSGILSARFLRHPVARVQTRQRYRQRVAELFQMYRQFREADYPPLSAPRVSFGEAVSGGELLARAGKDGLMPAVIASARNTLDEHMVLGGLGI